MARGEAAVSSITVPPESVVKVQTLLDAIYLSSAEGRRVEGLGHNQPTPHVGPPTQRFLCHCHGRPPRVGRGRIAALHNRASAKYQIHY